ncbi:MAG: DUF1289 domain-containing protein [Richelia sp. RM2_1_2]|nr:DUF1289 domain-containing protein [Richelia sp. RM2_1_2]
MEDFVPSPCIAYCKKDRNGVCQGCFRTVEEISIWLHLSNEERRLVLLRADERIEQLPTELREFVKKRNAEWRS